MPLARSKTTRSKSHSPASTSTPKSSTPKTFLPPSYYAAASGYTSRTASVAKHGDSSGKNAQNMYGESKNNISQHFVNVFSSSSNPSGSRTSISSGEDPLPLAPVLKYQNSRSGFTDIEAKLLPSLRDTIDRMTRDPTRSSTPHKNDTTIGQTYKLDCQNESRHMSSEQNISRKQTRSKEKHSNFQNFANYYSPSTIEESTTPKILQGYTNEGTPTLGASSLQTKGAGKSSFKKPSLKSPMTNPDTKPFDNASVTGSSLRTMKTLTRKCSETLRSPFSNSKSFPEKTHRSKEVESSKNRDEIQSLNKEPIKVTRDHAEADAPRSFSVARKNFQSNIPRPRSRYYHDEPQRSHDQSEESDLDREYENDSRNRRKLTVANAEVTGSSSESDADPRQNASLLHKPSVRNPRQDEYSSAIGLGLSLQSNGWDRMMNANSQDTRDNKTRFQDNQELSTQEKTLRFSLPVSDSDISAYSEELKDNNGQGSRRGYEDENNTKHLGTSSACREIKSSRLHSVNNSGRMGDDAFLEDGISIYRTHTSRSHKRRSLSASPKATTYVVDPGTESEQEGYHRRRSMTKQKRRSASCTPLAKCSPEAESDGFVPIVPSRPRSACQRYDLPSSPQDSQPFPPNLRDLIRSRHSFSKLSTPATKKYPSSPRKSPGRQQEQHNHQTFSRDKSKVTAAAAIVEDYRSAAARERMAFGIPPSESDNVVDGEESLLTQSGSETTSVQTFAWQQDKDDDNFSESAKSIFDAFSSSKYVSVNEREDESNEKTPRLSVIPPSLSGSSAPDERRFEASKWRDMGIVSGQTCTAMAGKGIEETSMKETFFPGEEMPKSREAVIQEIFETEEMLLYYLNICMKIFILPLRVNNSRLWISGVPPNVARLFDWFDDIVNLHDQVYHSLCSARDTMSPATDRVSESLRCFVLKGETYQPYLVRLADVSEEIIQCINNPKSDFGQFIAIQQQSSQCEGWTLERLLMLPVNRLAAYQDLFARLLDLTPKTHQDYLSTFSLSRSMDMLIKVMTEVKIREDEYSLLKAFSSRIQGLPLGNKLAIRERKLLHSGPLLLIVSGLLTPFSTEDYQPAHDFKHADRSSRLLDAVSTASSALEKSDSEGSASSFAAALSASAGITVNSAPAKTSWLSRLPLRKRSKAKQPMPHNAVEPPLEPHSNIRNIFTDDLQTVEVHVFVFTDLVLLAQPLSNSGRKSRWVLFNDLGLFKPLSIARIDHSRQDQIILSLEALDLHPENLNENVDFRSAAFRTVDLLLPLSLGSFPTEELNDHQLLQPWLHAFQQCLQTTLQKLTFVGRANQDEHFIGSDKVLDTFLAVSSLVGSGLPIPRSPSGHIPNILGHDRERPSGDEREERGWWSLRYQQIFREFQRQDALLFDD